MNKEKENFNAIDSADEMEMDLNEDIESCVDLVNLSDSVRRYLVEIGQYPLLSPEEELELGAQVQRGLEAEAELSMAKAKDPAKDPDRCRELKMIVRAGKIAEQRMTECNLRLVVSIARRYHGRTSSSMSFMDIIQEGNLGLMKAVKKYNPEKGFRFSTCATWWIRQNIERGIADQSRAIRIPVHVQEILNKIRKLQRKMELQGIEPTSQKIAEALKMTTGEVEQLLLMAETPTSLETPVMGEDDGRCQSTLGDFIPDERSASVEDETVQEMMAKQVEKVLAGLPDRTAEIIRMRYGLGEYEPHTLSQVGEAFGITRERVRQIQKQVITYLKHPARIRMLQG